MLALRDSQSDPLQNPSQIVGDSATLTLNPLAVNDGEIQTIPQIELLGQEYRTENLMALA